jgi:DNA-binding NarL/FixJ family response regulator
MNMDPPSEKVATIIVSRPGIIRQALRTMLALLPQIEITAAFDGGLSVLESACQHRPALLVIDLSLPEDEIMALLRQIKQEQPLVHCLVVAETTRQQAAVLAQGADAVILRSDPSERLVDALNNMGLW